MSSARAFRLTSRIAFATAILMFGLIVIGSVVRTTGSGLACPDWPLCHGQLIPPMQFNILVEWFHRLVALLVSLLLAATAVSVYARREVRSVLGGLTTVALALLATQVLLGALTVWKLLHATVVSSHLGVALLLFSTLLLIGWKARAHAGAPPPAPSTPGLAPLFLGATVLLFAQVLVGGAVSTQYAGLACPDWPTCNGEWFPPMTGLVGVHLAHRWLGYLTATAMVLVAIRSRHSGDPLVRALGPLALGLTVAQVAIGVVNVLAGVPIAVSALHLGNAAAILATLVTLTFRAAAAPAGAPAGAALEAR